MNPESRLNARLDVLRLLIQNNGSNGQPAKSDAEMARSAIVIADTLCDHVDGKELDRRLSAVK